MTAFSWIGLQLAEHWRGLAEIGGGLLIAAALMVVAAVVIASRSGLSRR